MNFFIIDKKGCKKIIKDFFVTFCHIVHKKLQKNEIKITKIKMGIHAKENRRDCKF